MIDKGVKSSRIMSNDLVSIVMLSHNNGRYLKETIESVMAQTYQNWELLFVDDYSNDDSMSQLMEIKEKDDKQRTQVFQNWNIREITRFNVVQMVNRQGEAISRNSALRDAKGRWIAFLNVGDVWSPDKLEKQVAFMEKNGYAFSYTQYGLMNPDSRERGIVVGGRDHLTHEDFLKCCWPSYLTVMYDRKKVGNMSVLAPQNNDYALWLNVSEHADCYLLKENLATMRTKWASLLGKVLLTNSAKWRYDAYRYDEDLKPAKSFLYTIRNGCYGLVKWMKYVERK